MLRAIADEFPHLWELLLYAHAVDLDGAARGFDVAGQALEGGGLARPVHPQKGEAFPVVETEGGALHGQVRLLEKLGINLSKIMNSNF